ncbi:hypothetical protein B0H13DRAFT_2233563 [Mycena leptocephala]|nr:hypothetical protein B0H13DRAFT_2233563 [Mycena leptocephala]
MGTDARFALDIDSGPTAIDEEDTEEFLAEIMQNAGEQVELCTRNDPSAEWSPYPSKMLFLLDTLDNLPRLRISNSLMKVFLWILKESGAHDVPSFDHLRKKCGVTTTQYKSAKGNIFHMNHPRTLIAKDWANPETRKFIRVYPEIPEDGKWRKDMDLDNLSPMYAGQYCYFYVNELARLKTGELVIPIRWVKFKNAVCADAFKVEINSEGLATVLDETTILISASELTSNLLDLEDENAVPQWTDNTTAKGYPNRMPNPKRALAEGDQIYSSFVDYFGDDVSGNRSKNLPRELLQQEFHVHFIATSPNASVTEQFTAFKTVIEHTHKDPVKVHDAETHETTRLCICSEITGHIEAKGNHMCRKCKAGGTEKDKETDTCFHSLFEPGTPRWREEILAELNKQVKLACAGVAQPIKNTQTGTGIKDAYTQYWIDYLLEQFKEKKGQSPPRSNTEIEEELIRWTLDNEDKIYSGFLTLKGFDPTKDTPVEILHTILLGVVKYIWHSSHTKTYSQRLQSTSTDGLSIHAIRANYIMQYANSLIDRQFKTIAQTNVFHVHGLVTDAQFATWRAVGELSALLWFTEIRNLKEYCNNVRIAAGNVLDAFAVLDPTKIITKIKLHLLAHLPEDITAFGPLVGVITEIYECFNAVFRFCSILSNHLAPSRDIALQLADQEGLKHRLTGGWWPSTETAGEWEQAGPDVCAFLHTRPVLQKLVGWTIKNPPVPGSVKLVLLPKRKKGSPPPQLIRVHLSATHAAHALNSADYDMATTWFLCKQGEIIVGRIDSILDNGSGGAVVILDVFHVSDTRHAIFGMPVLARRQSEITYLIVPAADIKFLFNAQPDCGAASCTASGKRPRIQERLKSDLMDMFIVHQPLAHFIINTHVFHNAHLLRQVLPRHLTVPIPLFPDRQAKHYELAATLRVTKDAKRKRAQEKREAITSTVHSTTQKGKDQSQGKKNKAAKSTKKQKAREIEVEDPEVADTSSDSDDDGPDSDDEERPRKRRKTQREPDSDSDYDGGAGATSEQAAEGGSHRPQRTRRAPPRFAMNAYVDSDSDSD